MSGGFNLDDYVDVASRIHEFAEKYPEGSLQAHMEFLTEPSGWFCVARAYRTADDERPGIGHAFEPVPGKTPYTKDSEAQNAETAAWGRAIVALGFQTKKIASKQEVQARQGGSQNGGDGQGGDTQGLQQARGDTVTYDATDPQKNLIKRLESKLDVTPRTNVDAISKRDASKLIEELKAMEEGVTVPAAAKGGGDMDDIPFAPVIA